MNIKYITDKRRRPRQQNLPVRSSTYYAMAFLAIVLGYLVALWANAFYSEVRFKAVYAPTVERAYAQPEVVRKATTPVEISDNEQVKEFMETQTQMNAYIIEWMRAQEVINAGI